MIEISNHKNSLPQNRLQTIWHMERTLVNNNFKCSSKHCKMSDLHMPFLRQDSVNQRRWKSMSLRDFNWRRIDLLLWRINWCVIAKVRKARPIKSMISLLSFGKHIGQIHHVNPKTLTMDNALGVCILTPSWCKLINWKEFVKGLASLYNHIKCVSFNQAKSFL